MKKVLVVGNWKSNKTIAEGIEWVVDFGKIFNPDKARGCQVVLCVPFTHLFPLKERIEQLKTPLELGAQDASPFPEGAFTGEVSGRMIAEVAEWVLVGHSERRKYLLETEEELVFEVEQAKTAGLQVLYCVSDSITNIPYGADVVGYEPIGAIGSGQAESPTRANLVCGEIKKKSRVETVLYGGSVTPENVAQFIKQESIGGVLVGGVSLKVADFIELIYAAA